MKRRQRCPVWSDGLPPGYASGRRPAEARYAAPRPANEPQNGFLRGAISAGLLAAIAPEVGRREALRRALQGGTALAAGIAGADAIDRRDYGTALLALAAGTAGLCAIDQLFSNSPSHQDDSTHEQEKT